MQFKMIYLDDEPALCQMFEDNFDWPNLNVKVFTESKLAIKEATEFGADLIFIDYRLSGTTADEVAKLLPHGVPLVLLTGELNPTPQWKFVKIFGKPFRFSEMEEFIRERIHERGLAS